GVGGAAAFFGFSVNVPFAFLTPVDGDTLWLGSNSTPPIEEIERLERDFNTLREQIDEITQDANYRGINLLRGEQLVSFFNETNSSRLVIQGANFTAFGLGIGEADFSTLATSQIKADEARNAL